MTIRFLKLKARLIANPKVKAEYDALGHRRSFATDEVSGEKAQAISTSRMDQRHAPLDGWLEPE